METFFYSVSKGRDKKTGKKIKNYHFYLLRKGYDFTNIGSYVAPKKEENAASNWVKSYLLNLGEESGYSKSFLKKAIVNDCQIRYDNEIIRIVKLPATPKVSVKTNFPIIKGTVLPTLEKREFEQFIGQGEPLNNKVYLDMSDIITLHKIATKNFPQENMLQFVNLDKCILSPIEELYDITEVAKEWDIEEDYEWQLDILYYKLQLPFENLYFFPEQPETFFNQADAYKRVKAIIAENTTLENSYIVRINPPQPTSQNSLFA